MTMKRLLSFFALSSCLLLLSVPSKAQVAGNATSLDGQVERIVMNGRARLTVKITDDSIPSVAHPDTSELSYSFNAASGLLTVSNGTATLWMPMPQSLSIETHGHASVKIPEGDTLMADNISIHSQEFSRVIISAPINSDTLMALSFGHSLISLDAIEGYVVNFSEQEFSRINVDRRSLLIKHTPKRRRGFRGYRGYRRFGH